MKNICSLFLLAFLLNACASENTCPPDKETYLMTFNQLMNETSSLRAPLDDPAWDEYDERFRMLVEECYETHEDALKGGEKSRFWFKAMSYYKNRYGKAALDQWIWGKKKSED